MCSALVVIGKKIIREAKLGVLIVTERQVSNKIDEMDGKWMEGGSESRSVSL